MSLTNTVDDFNNIINDCFNENRGFGKHRDVAIKLLKDTIQILDEFKIQYFLISGTLLGYVRHNGFIPWDDDIDLIVDPSIFDKLPKIIKKYNKMQIYNIPWTKWMMKICYKNGIKPEEKCELPWTWPFIDLFVYSYNDDKTQINFFNKQWEANKFFSPQKVQFMGINASIPNDPTYFLTINYGPEYMTTFKSSPYCHRYEKHIELSVELKIKKM